MVIFPLTKNKSPAVPKGTSWQEFKGEANTPLIGIMIPNGVFIIDIDTYKGVTTSNIDEALGVKLDWDNAELQKTLNGGMHYAFSVPDDSNMINDSDVLGIEGFDTRSACKGYIATGEGYENLTFNESIIEALKEPLPELPLSVVTQLSTDNKEEPDDLLSLISAEPLDITEEDVDYYLSLLNESHSEDRSTWLKIGMGIYHQLGQGGWNKFDSFSKLCKEKYNKNANRRTWESFKTKQVSKPVTFASVINLVGGTKVKSKAVISKLDDNIDTIDDINTQLKQLANCSLDNLQLDTALKKIASRYKALTGTSPTQSALKKELKRLRDFKQNGDFVDDYVFLTGAGDYMQRETKTTMGVRAFNVKHNRDTPPNGEGENQTASNYSDNIIECVHDAMYVPAFGEIFSHGGVDYFNSYRPNNIEGVDKGYELNIIQRIKGHIAHLLPKKDEQQLVINYLAHNVQYPGVKIQWAMLLQGVQGDGKSLLAEMMQLVLGINNVRVMNPQTLESNFTGWAVGQCMTFIEELKIDNYRKYEVINNIKPYITNTTIEVTKKGCDPQVCINTTNYFALTNFKDAIPIDDNDRRYCILFSQWQRKDKLTAWMEENKGYYPNLYEDMRNSAKTIYNWLSSHKIPKSFMDMKRAPITDAKNAMIDLSKSEAYLIVEDALSEFNCEQINDDFVNLTYLQSKVDDDFSDYKNFPKTSALKNVLLDMGYHNVGRYKNADRKNQLIYAKDDTKKAIEFKDIIEDCPF